MDKVDLAFLLHRNTTRRVGERLGLQLMTDNKQLTAASSRGEEDVTKRVTMAHTHQFSARLLLTM